MTRPSLAQRLAAQLGGTAEDLIPDDFQEGRASLLRLLHGKGTLSSLDLQRFLAEQTGHPTLGGERTEISVGELPEGLLRDHEVVTVGRESDPLYGVVWAQDVEVVDEIASYLGHDFPRAVVSREDVVEQLTVTQQIGPNRGEDSRGMNEVETLLETMGNNGPEIQVVDSYDLLEEVSSTAADEAPIIKLLNLIIVQGCQAEASDIHIEPEENVSRVRYRVDGFLKEVMLPPKRFHNALVSRIKIMSDLDIAEKRTPQDGRIKLRLGENNVDVRVSTIPSIYGEKVVLRLLREESILLGIEEIGLAPDQVEKFRSLATRPYGIILVTGPTGSGKSTTLYSTLNFLNTKAKNIVTIEDPVEYQMENISQIQVNRRAGIDFASGLKSILRQDPDIIMVGEMRDEETAAIAVKAALTGHLVLSSLHTNDAPGAYARLVDMKVAPYLLASSVVGVVAQRLVRLICKDCKIPDDPDPASRALVGLNPEDRVELYRGEGCTRCGGTGYRGRRGIFEFLTPTREVKKLLLSGQIGEGVEIPGFRRMADYGRDAILAGHTSVEEICRVVRVQGAS